MKSPGDLKSSGKKLNMVFTYWYHRVYLLCAYFTYFTLLDLITQLLTLQASFNLHSLFTSFT